MIDVYLTVMKSPLALAGERIQEPILQRNRSHLCAQPPLTKMRALSGGSLVTFSILSSHSLLDASSAINA